MSVERRLGLCVLRELRGKPECPAGCSKVQRDADPGGCAQPYGWNQKKTGGNGAEGGAGRVGTVQHPGVGGRPGGRGFGFSPPLCGDWKRRAHGGGRNAEDRQADSDADDGEARGCGAVSVRPREYGSERVQRTRQQGGEKRDANLEAGIYTQTRCRSAAVPTGPTKNATRDPRPAREAAHEGGQHRTGRGNGVPQLKGEQPRPDNFVDERCGAGRHVQEEEQPPPAHGAWYRTRQGASSWRRSVL